MTASNPVALAVPCPPPGTGDQLYVKVPVPPEPVAVAVPSDDPLQLMSVPVIEEVIGLGSIMVTSSDIVHPLASVTSNV